MKIHHKAHKSRCQSKLFACGVAQGDITTWGQVPQMTSAHVSYQTENLDSSGHFPTVIKIRACCCKYNWLLFFSTFKFCMCRLFGFKRASPEVPSGYFWTRTCAHTCPATHGDVEWTGWKLTRETSDTCELLLTVLSVGSGALSIIVPHCPALTTCSLFLKSSRLVSQWSGREPFDNQDLHETNLLVRCRSKNYFPSVHICFPNKKLKCPRHIKLVLGGGGSDRVLCIVETGKSERNSKHGFDVFWPKVVSFQVWIFG